MTLEKTRVLEKFRLYSGEEAGDPDPAREALCEALCGDCAASLAGQIRELPPEELEASVSALESLAAAEAFYQLALTDGALGMKSVSTPELKLELENRAEKAQRLAEEKRKACAAVLKEKGFYFGRA